MNLTFWIARDNDNDLTLFADKPIKRDDYFIIDDNPNYYNLDPNLYPEITYENSPMEMNLISTINSNKQIRILKTLLNIVQEDHPEFEEEHTTGWDLIENAKMWLKEL